MAVASRVPDRRSPLPAIFETCTWLPRSYSGLFHERHLDSEDNWPMHERCRESSRVALPVRRGFRDSSSSQQAQVWHLSLAFSKFVESDFPHRASPWLVVQNLLHALIVITPTYHDHDVSAREEPMHSVIQTTVQRVVILGFQNGLRNSRISTTVFPEAFVVVGIIELSAVDHPYRTTVAHSWVVVHKTANKLVVDFSSVQFFVRPPEFVTTMRRPRRLFKIRKSTAHDNRICLEHTPRNFTTANIDHRIRETIGKIRLVRISSRAVNTKFIVKVDDKIIQKKITHIVVVFQMVNSNHEQTCSYLSINFQ